MRFPWTRATAVLCLVALMGCGSGNKIVNQIVEGFTQPFAVSPGLVTVDEDGNVAILLTGMDQTDETDQLTITVTTGPTNGGLDLTTGPAPLMVTYTPAPDFNGADELRFRVTDTDGEDSAIVMVPIQVTAQNDPPVADDETASTDQFTAVNIDVLTGDSDPDDTVLLVTDVSAPASGTVTINGNHSLTYAPTPATSGDVIFTYTLEDPHGASDTGTVTVTVTPVTPLSVGPLTATPNPIEPGNSLTLNWSSTAATSCALGDGDSTLSTSTSGPIMDMPTEATLYTLTCQGPGGPKSTQIVVGVSLSVQDFDNDGIPDSVELLLGYDPADDDTDNDGLLDGVEDANADGIVQVTETDALDADSDDDSLLDGEEDANHNAMVDMGETDPRDPDTDDDGWCDGTRTDNDGDGIDPADPCQTVGDIWYVDASHMGMEDGASWGTAFDRIMEAMAFAQPRDQIWVAAGTYRAGGVNAAVITMSDEVDVYGGFLGTETDLSQRPDPSLNPSILDGDYDMDGNFTADDSIHVVIGASDAVLDGFTVTAGRASVGSGDTLYGGGIFNKDVAGMAVRNAIVSENRAFSAGAGVYNLDSEVTFDQVLFYHNESTPGTGAAGMYNSGSTVAILNSTWNQNVGYSLASTDSVITLAGNVFDANYKGGVQHSNDSSGMSIFADSVFRNSTTTGDSGGYSALRIVSSSPIVTGNLFADNVNYKIPGGAISVVGSGSNPLIVNNTFADNLGQYGGAVGVTSDGAATVANCTFIGNEGDISGGATYGSDLMIENSVFWDNTAPGGAHIQGSPTVSNSCIPGGFAGTGNINLMSDPTVLAASGEVFLDQMSACANLGDDADADTAFFAAARDWRNYTTNRDSALPDPDITPGSGGDVDAGAHHDPANVWIKTFNVTVLNVSWTTNSAESCVLTAPGFGTYYVPPGNLASGMVSHSLMSGIAFTLTCEGNPFAATAEGIVP